MANEKDMSRNPTGKVDSSQVRSGRNPGGLIPATVNGVAKRSKLSIPSSTSISFPESDMSEARDCVVKLVDDHGVEHSVRVRAESV